AGTPVVDPAFAPGGQVFAYMGVDGPVDLGSQDWSDYALWQLQTPSTFLTGSLAFAVLSEAGAVLNNDTMAGSSVAYYGLVDNNDVRSLVSASVFAIDLRSRGLSVTATGAGTITAYDDSTVSPWDGLGGVLVTNTVQASATASVTNSSLDTRSGGVAGDITVRALNATAIDATATSTIEGAWDAKSAVLAFNSIGWKGQNVLSNAIDTLLGDPLLSSAMSGQNPAVALAFIRDTPIRAGGNLTVEAISALALNAVAGNESVVEAAIDLLFVNAGGEDGYGASGMAAGILMAANKALSSATASIDFTGATRGIETAGGDIVVHASDDAGISSTSTVIQDVTTSNTATGIADIINGIIVPSDYDWTTSSGSREITTGDHVRLGSDYTGGGVAGGVYEYLGASGLVDLGAQDFTTATLWRQVIAPTDPASLYPNLGNLTDSDARGIG
ncbi:MAG TPA: hypothetical protein PLA46_12775, partial [Phycicoccus sp.]|nr:hypothetical protein [Phycicoccus sp.]